MDVKGKRGRRGEPLTARKVVRTVTTTGAGAAYLAPRALGGPVINRMLVSDLLGFTAARQPATTTLVFEDRSWSYAELYRRVCQLANGLLGIAEPGDRIAILAENRPEYVEAYYGVPMAGMVLTFLNFRLHPRELAHILENSGATVLIAEPAYYDLLKEFGALD